MPSSSRKIMRKSVVGGEQGCKEHIFTDSIKKNATRLNYSTVDRNWTSWILNFRMVFIYVEEYQLIMYNEKFIYSGGGRDKNNDNACIRWCGVSHTRQEKQNKKKVRYGKECWYQRSWAASQKGPLQGEEMTSCTPYALPNPTTAPTWYPLWRKAVRQMAGRMLCLRLATVGWELVCILVPKGAVWCSRVMSPKNLKSIKTDISRLRLVEEVKLRWSDVASCADKGWVELIQNPRDFEYYTIRIHYPEIWFFQTAFAIPSSLSLLGLWLALEGAILLSPRFANNTPSSVLPCQTAGGFVRCLKQAKTEPKL